MSCPLTPMSSSVRLWAMTQKQAVQSMRGCWYATKSLRARFMSAKVMKHYQPVIRRVSVSFVNDPSPEGRGL